MNKILALDIGSKRIGIAITDDLGLAAHPVCTLQRRQGYKANLKEICEIIKELEAGSVVVGIPLNSDGSEGPQALACRNFAEKLSEVVDIPVEVWDESLSTMEAEQILINADRSRSKRKKVVDQIAAVLILESYLSAKRS